MDVAKLCNDLLLCYAGRALRNQGWAYRFCCSDRFELSHGGSTISVTMLHCLATQLNAASHRHVYQASRLCPSTGRSHQPTLQALRRGPRRASLPSLPKTSWYVWLQRIFTARAFSLNAVVSVRSPSTRSFSSHLRATLQTDSVAASAETTSTASPEQVRPCPQMPEAVRNVTLLAPSTWKMCKL